MEKVTVLSDQHEATTSENEFGVKEEVNEDFNYYGDENSVKCGEVLFLQTEQMVLICGFCEKSYGDMNEFGAHIQENHQNHILKKPTIKTFGKTDGYEMLEIEIVDDGLHDYDDISDYEESPEIDHVDITKEAERPKRQSTTPRKGIKDPDLYCTICKKQYEKRRFFIEHNERRHNQPRPCKFCDIPFASNEEREEHEKTHVGDSPYPCPLCPMAFTLGASRNKHIASVHKGLKPHKCSKCDRSFATGISLRNHQIASHSQAGRFSCELCGRQFAMECQKKTHVCLNEAEKTFQCEECGKHFMTQPSLKSHKKCHTDETNVDIVIPKDEDETQSDWSGAKPCFKVEVISDLDLEKESKRRKRLTKAQRKDIKDPTMYCTICKLQFGNRPYFHIHNEKLHNMLRPCRFCNKPFDSREERSQHEKTHVGDSPYPCPQCTMGFKQRYTRDKHIEHVHEGIKRYKCSVCDRSFATGTILRAHQTVHASVPGRYSCEICGRQFAHESVMKLHVKFHKGEKSFQCEECGDRFYTRSFLNNHLRCHGEKNFECEICGKKFYTKGSLRAHSQVHSERLYACSMCGNAFKTKKHLKRHMDLHSDVKKYSCAICGKEFAQSVGLYSHKKTCNVTE